MAEEAAVLTEKRDGVLLITLNRPDARNAINGAVAEGVGHALDELDSDDALQIAILTGAGKGFSSGMDLKAFIARERPYFEDRGFAGIVQRPPEKPSSRRSRASPSPAGSRSRWPATSSSRRATRSSESPR